MSPIRMYCCNEIHEHVSITQGVFKEIISSIGQNPPETGGILGCDSSGILCSFHYDRFGISKPHNYIPDEQHLNQLIMNVWHPKHIFYCGFVHSHSPECPQLSEADYQYAENVLLGNPSMKKIIMILVIPNEEIAKIRFSVASILYDGKRTLGTINIV